MMTGTRRKKLVEEAGFFKKKREARWKKKGRSAGARVR